jgi:hypothetical protein
MSAISTCLSRCPVEVLRLGRGTVGRHVQGFLGLHTASNAALCSFTARIVACAPARPPDRLEGGAGDRLAQFDPVAVVVARTVRRGGGAARRRTTARRHLSGPASRSDEDRPQPQGLRQLLRRRAQPPAGLPALLAPDPDGAAHHPVPQIVSDLTGDRLGRLHVPSRSQPRRGRPAEPPAGLEGSAGAGRGGPGPPR